MTTSIDLNAPARTDAEIAEKRKGITRAANRTPKRVKSDRKPGPAKVYLCTGLGLTAEEFAARTAAQ